jgi:hypothetical protein
MVRFGYMVIFGYFKLIYLLAGRQRANDTE